MQFSGVLLEALKAHFRHSFSLPITLPRLVITLMLQPGRQKQRVADSRSQRKTIAEGGMKTQET